MSKSKFTLNFLIIISLLLVTLSSCNINDYMEPDGATGSFTDTRDGTTYNTVKIGSHWWMSENLNYQTDSASWCYNDDPQMCAVYGRLYTLEAALVACPSGWRLPTEEEYLALEEHLGMDPEDNNLYFKAQDRALTTGGKLKEAGTSHWKSPNSDANNSSGFTALPAGYRDLYGGKYQHMGEDAWFWTSSETSPGYAHVRELYYNLTGIGAFKDKSSRFGLSVRCIK
ncbi:MAG: hypothetical protein J7L96_04435 [Bacteroidales bacterium]|nr:hypothetical protein [Bacteroidales bacterium]